MKLSLHRSGNRKGIVLVLALWVIVILSGIAMNFALSTRTGSIVTRNFKESIVARTMAVSAIENTIAYILADPDLQVDYLDEKGNFRMDNDREPASKIINSAGATIEVTLTDEDSKLNINLLEPAYLQGLIGDYAKSDEETLEMAAALMDWRDPDDLHRLGGAEDETYMPLGYETKDAMLEIPGELALVSGFTKEIVYGSDGTGGLNELITTFTNTYNINTAPREVLEALGFDPIKVSSIMEMRDSLKGLQSVGSSLPPNVKFHSKVLRIETRVSFKGSPEEYHIVSIIKRESGKDGKLRLRTIYWRETIETGRA